MAEQTANDDRIDFGLAKWLATVVVAVVVAYYTAQSRVEIAQSRIEEREGNHYLELKASIDLLRQDLQRERDQRSAAPGR